jgi:hypothetical protein
VDQQDKELQKEAEKKLESIEVQVSGTKQFVNLYSLITNIEWDFDAPRNVIKGTVFLTKKNSVKPFEYPAMNENGDASPEVVNKIWDLMRLNYSEED